MAFTYIQRKPCKFPGCDRSPKMGAGGFCYEHEESDPGFKRKKDKKSADTQNKKLMLSISNSGLPSDLSEKIVDNAALKYLKDLKKFFEDAAIEIAKNPRCWECKEPISPKDYRNSTAHILPKEFFKSIATHPLAYVVAGARCGCHNKTHRLDLFSKMKIFPIAVCRFRQIEHLIKEKHKLLSEFKNYADLYEKNDNNIYVPGDSL